MYFSHNSDYDDLAIIYDTEIKFIIDDLPREKYQEILNKCKHDKLLYRYRKTGRYLYKMPLSIKTYIIDKLYDEKELYIILGLSKWVVNDCIGCIMNILFLVKIKDCSNYKHIKNLCY